MVDLYDDIVIFIHIQKIAHLLRQHFFLPFWFVKTLENFEKIREVNFIFIFHSFQNIAMRISLEKYNTMIRTRHFSKCGHQDLNNWDTV